MDLKQEIIQVSGYEKVVKFTEEASGLKAIIAIHNTVLGPGLGGTRIYPYATEEEALTDVLRLSKGMTYKAGMAGVGLGGAKSVIIADSKKDKTPELLKAFAMAVNTFEGKYICAEDIGCTPDDIETILQTTQYACGVCNLRGSGNPAAFTAWGTICGIKATLQELDGSPSLKGKTIAIQGVGSVGKRVIEHLFWAEANILVSDVDEEAVRWCVQQYGATAVPTDQIASVECDIFSPNAMGGIINPESIPHFKCRGIAGAANNQLLSCEDATLLKERGILYAPDFVINAGGLVNVVCELSKGGYDGKKARAMTTQIFDELLEVFEIAQQNNISTHQAVVSLVDHKLKNGIGKRTEELEYHTAALKS